MKIPGKRQRINEHRTDINEHLDAGDLAEILAVPESHHMKTMVAKGGDGSVLLLVTKNARNEFTTRLSVWSYPEAMVIAGAIIEAAGIAWPDGEAEMADWRAKNPDPRGC